MDDDLDDVWDKLGGPTPDPELGATAPEDAGEAVDIGAPLRVSFLVRSDKVPVAPWAQGWRVGAIGPDNGHVTIVAEHDIDLSPVAQLSAVTGLLGTLKQAQLEVVWWTIQARGPLELDQPDMDAELQQLLGREADDAPPDPHAT